MTFAWVIERGEKLQPGNLPEYFTGKTHPALRWSKPGDHLDACRFARKEDAERMLPATGEGNLVVEHGWGFVDESEVVTFLKELIRWCPPTPKDYDERGAEAFSPEARFLIGAQNKARELLTKTEGR